LRSVKGTGEATNSTLRSVLGLPESVAFAVPQCLQPRLEVLEEGGVGRLLHVLQLVGVGLEVV
jgi:hypothetical protein